MKAELRGLLEGDSGRGGGAPPPPGAGRRRQRARPEAEEQWMHVEVTGDKPQTFIVRGNLYINFSGGKSDEVP